MPESPLKVLLVDDQILFRQGLASLLGCQADFVVAGAASSVAEAVALARSTQPDVVLMDFELPDGTGIDAMTAIRAVRPQTAVVFLTVHGEDDRLFAAIRAGARGYLQKNERVERLLDYLRGVRRGEPALPPEAVNRLMNELARSMPAPSGDGPLAQLTARERAVFDELATGASNGDIAARLAISENTVRNHVTTIMAKLGLRNRGQAIAFKRDHRS
ncbi:MAG TPA: response regulator transcription factor [Anaerolineae bacterium]